MGIKKLKEARTKKAMEAAIEKRDQRPLEEMLGGSPVTRDYDGMRERPRKQTPK